MTSDHTATSSLPPDWQQRATAISSAATDTYVLVRANLVGHEPYDLHALHEGLRRVRQRLHEPHPALLPDPEQHTPEPPTTYRQAVARFSTALPPPPDTNAPTASWTPATMPNWPTPRTRY